MSRVSLPAESPDPGATWLSVHIYRRPVDEVFLAQVVAPRWERLFGEGWADELFFVRYFDGAPHLRLRLRPRVDGRELRGRVESLFEDEDVRWREYEPEVRRYGGPVGLKISEDLFGASSRAVLSLLGGAEEDGGWSYDASLSYGLLMHLALLHGVGWSFPELRRFCAALAETWAGFLVRGGGSRSRGRRLDDLYRHYDALYQHQKEAILPIVEAVWEAFDAEEELEEPWLEGWHGEASVAAAALSRAAADGELWRPEDVSGDGTIPEADRRRMIQWSIVGSWVHMTNNRLGVSNSDEGWLAYLTGRCLAAIEGEGKDG